MTSKDQLRVEARAKRARFAAALPEFAQSIARFAGDVPLAPGAVLASYWPLRDEADPRRLAAEMAQRGHPIVLPSIVERNAQLTFRLWKEGDAVAPGLFGVHEPHATAPVREPAAIFVPLLAFDARGHRLGYGGGYYDRTLAALRRSGRTVLAVGIAYSGQELEAPFTDDHHDQPLDMIVTELGVRRFG